MKRRFFSLVILAFTFCLSAQGQSYPPTWTRFTSDRYISAIEEDFNSSGISQTVFINSLLDRARLNVAKQISISIADEAKLVKSSLNGITNIEYTSRTSFSTEATMHLLRTDTDYQIDSKKGSAIAYLDKREVCGYWYKEAERIFQDQERNLSKVEKMVESGYKNSAKSFLEKIKMYSSEMDESLAWLGLCSYPDESFQELLYRFSSIIKTIDSIDISLAKGTSLFIQSTFIQKGADDDTFYNDPEILIPALSQDLSEHGVQLTDEVETADFVLDITTYTLSRSKPSNGRGFYSYYANAFGKLYNRHTGQVEAAISIERHPECYAAGMTPEQAGKLAFQSSYLRQFIVDKILNSINR